MEIHIPLLTLQILFWIICGAISTIVITLISCLVGWSFRKIFETWRTILAYIGVWAAFWNYLQVKQKLMKGGNLGEYIKPKEPFIVSWQEERKKAFDRMTDHMSVEMLFEIKAHPEAWRWWMCLLGYKKPESDSVNTGEVL